MLWLCLCCATAHAGQQYYNVDSLLNVLDAVIDSSEVYNRQLQHELIQYRQRYDNAPSPEARFDIAHELFLHYRKYRLDSALHYARQRVKIAADLGEPDSLSSAHLDEADALKCLGRLHDALHVLE